MRKDFAVSEGIAIGEAVRVHKEAKARERQIEGQKSGGRGKKKLSVESTESINEQSRDEIAAVAGMGWQKYEKARVVVDLAKADEEFDLGRTREIIELEERILANTTARGTWM